MMKYLASISLLILLIISCSKKSTDNNSSVNKYCWQLVDFNGNNLEMVCNKTESELVTDYQSGVYGTNFTSCNYYKVDGPKNSWMINNTFYKSLYTDQARLMAHCFNNNTTPIQVDSNYCKIWYTKEIITFKPNQSTYYSGIRSQYYCADSLKTIYQGRQIVLKDVTDTLIVLEFSSDGMQW